MERKNHFINIITKYINQIPIMSIFIKHNCLFGAENTVSLSAIKIMKLILESALF